MGRGGRGSARSRIAPWVALLMGLLVAASLADAQGGESEGAFVFAYFVGNGEDGLHLATSRDGLTWQTLNGGEAVWRAGVGSQGLMRDPHLSRGPDGTFHLVWTTGWEGRDIGYASSPDLLRWSEPRALPVMAHEPDALNSWAPELFYDAQDARFLVFWSSTIAGRFDDTHRIYRTTTRDFETFTPTELFYEPGFNVIDASIVRHGEGFAMLIKDETGGPDGINEPGGRKSLHVATSTSASGPYGPPGPAFVGETLDGFAAAVEGPTAVRIGELWHVYFDYYRQGRFGLATSPDLRSWTDRSDDLAMPQGARHGSMLAVPHDVLAGLIGATTDRVLLPTAETTAHTWRYTTTDPGPDWTHPEFDDTDWSAGPAGFGQPDSPGAIVGTEWTERHLWLRTDFELDALPSNAYLRLHHDEDMEVYLNGQLIRKLPQFTLEYVDVGLAPEAMEAFRVGRNVVAVHCRRSGFGQYCDLGVNDAATP